MKYSKVNICIIFAVFLFCTCSSTKKASSAQASATQVSSSSSSDISNNKFTHKGQVTTVTGTLDMYSAGKYPYYINKGSGKNITSYFLLPDEAHQEVYYELYKYYGQKVQIKGYEISRKSSWNITLAVTEVTIIE